MFFARIAIAALSVVGVLAGPFASPQSGSHHVGLTRIGIKTARDTVSSYNTALTQLKGLKSQVADAMAGPKSDREGKFIDITGNTLQVLKDYQASLPATPSLIGLPDSQLSDELNQISITVTRILRSTKGLRSDTIATNIDGIMNSMDDLKTLVVGLIPSIVGLLGTFDISMTRLSAIYSAVSA